MAQCQREWRSITFAVFAVVFALCRTCRRRVRERVHGLAREGEGTYWEYERNDS